MFNCIDNFYERSDLGLLVLGFLNLNFSPCFQSQHQWYGGDRMKGYPCHETSMLDTESSNIFISTFEKKTNLKILDHSTFLRKTYKKELKKSPCWGQYKQHVDHNSFDIAGVVYFNSNSIEDGTYFYHSKSCYEPTAIIGAKVNRIIFYDSQTPHCPPMKQTTNERWSQPFFLKVQKND